MLSTLANPPGDVEETYADIAKAQEILDYQPKTEIKVGIPKFQGSRMNGYLIQKEDNHENCHRM